MDKFKVGIITYHRSYNYGSALQSFATVRVVDNLGYESMLIDFQNIYDKNVYKTFYWNSKKSILSNLKNILKNIVFRLESRGKQNFTSFVDNIPKTHEFVTCIDNCDELQDFDILLLGSDQVWNAKITGDILESAYLLDVSGNMKKMSYACSFGSYVLKDTEIDYFKEKLKEFSYISVREEFSQNVINKLLPNASPNLVLDPTLLMNCSEWKSCFSFNISKFNLPEQYVLVYLMVKYEQYEQIIREMKKITNLPVVIICNYTVLPLKRKDIDYYLKDVTPIDFIGLIYHARYVITSSYHGTVFSVNFNKSFFSLYHKKNSLRALEFLTRLGLENRILKDVDEIHKIGLDIDYNKPNQLLNIERSDSIKWLKYCLDSIKKEIGEQ